MTAPVLIAVPLPDGRWLALPRETFDEALRRAVEMKLTVTSSVATTTATTPERLVTSEEMGKLMQVASTTVEARAARGEIPSIRIGRTLRFAPATVLAALAANNGGNGR